jgi:Ca2+-binding EF-hand superfamily protein
MSFLDKLTAMMEKKDGAAKMRDLWNKLDNNDDGKITGKEWGSKVYQEQELMSEFFGGSTLSEIGQAFNRIDSNGSDSLTWDEFRTEIDSYKALKQINEAMATQRSELKNLWDSLDQDMDGKLSSKEWGSKVWQNKEAMAKFFGGSDMASIGRAFGRIDQDGNDSLSWDEFCGQSDSYRAVQQMQTALDTEEGKNEFKALWDDLDKNGDGKVSSKEWGSKVFQNKDAMSKYFGGSDLASIGKMFNRIDANGDDSLSWEEFESSVLKY